MRHILISIFALLLAACGSTSTSTTVRDQELVSRAIAAMGGADAMRSLRALQIRGTVKHWEPEQSHIPGGEARFAAESTFETTVDFANHATRTDWVKNFAYPSPRTFKFSEIVTPDAGYVIGIDSNGRNAQSLKANPPAHTMSGLRLAAAQRELRRSSPPLLLEMRANPTRVSRMNDVTVNGVNHPALNYNAGSFNFIVLFDQQTGLPARVRTQDLDNIWGDVDYDLVFSDWQAVSGSSGARIATTQRYELNGRVVVESRITQTVANPQINPASMSIPAELRASAAKPAVGNIPYQWVLRRQFIGTYLDSESASYDALASSGLRLHELAPGVQHVVGGSHNSLIVEMRDHLIVFDAPVSDWQSGWTIRTAQAKYNNKPIRYLVLTHHHMDHAGGLRAYIAQGATLVVGAGAAEHYRRVLAAPATRNPDLAPREYAKVNIIEVKDRQTFSDGKREVSAHAVENPHAASTLLGYVADARIAFVTDIYTPGPPLPPKINPALASVVNAVRQAGIQPVTVAGGHGSNAPYAMLAALAGQ